MESISFCVIPGEKISTMLVNPPSAPTISVAQGGEGKLNFLRALFF
jgi:hypothetical protein